MWGLGQHTLLGIVVGFLKYVWPQATHFTGYCCWFMLGLGQHTLLGIVVGFMWVLGQHTLLGIDVWLTLASGNTHYWVLLLVYVGPRATQFTGHRCLFPWASVNTHYWVLLLAYVEPWATHFTGSDVSLQQWAKIIFC
jgi:hypothetical protein